MTAFSKATAPWVTVPFPPELRYNFWIHNLIRELLLECHVHQVSLIDWSINRHGESPEELEAGVFPPWWELCDRCIMMPTELAWMKKLCLTAEVTSPSC